MTSTWTEQDILGLLDFDHTPPCEIQWEEGDAFHPWSIGHKEDPPPADWLVVWVNPLTCGCKASDAKFVCDACWHKLASAAHVHCGRCGAAVAFHLQVKRRVPVRGC